MLSGEKPLLSVHELGVCYGNDQVVEGFSLDVSPAQIVGIVGESGSGKTTVLRAIAGGLGAAGAVCAGSIVFEGVRLAPPCAADADAARRRMAYTFQNAALSFDPLFRIGFQFDECLAASQGLRFPPIRKGRRREMRRTQRELLASMGFSDPDRVLAAYPHSLSGGECQRVALAMAVACEPSLLLADEPTSALDTVAKRQVSDALIRIRDEHGTAVMVVSHDMDAVAGIADRIVVMKDGRAVEMGGASRVLSDPRHPYTRSLVEAVPRLER